MNKYDYSAKSKNNVVSKGVIEASSREDAALVLGKKGLSPIAINEQSNFLGKILSINLFDRLSLTDKVMFCEEISTLVDSGVPLSQSITIIKEQSEKGTLKKVMGDVLKEIEGGQSLSGALERQPKHFSPVFVNMIRAGEASGNLDTALKDLAAQTQKDQDLVSKIRGAMMYPVFIVIAMVGALVFLMIKVVPQISSLFKELDAELPLTTRIMMKMSDITVKYGIYIGIAMAILIFVIYRVITTNQGVRKRLHLLIIKMPILGPISIKFNSARFARTFGSLMGSGVSVLESLDIVSNSLSNLAFREEIKSVAEKVRNGGSIAEPMKQSRLFPVMVSQMIGVGEEAGNLDKMLIKVAEFYERQIDNITKNISSLIEPIIMLVVGVAIGFVVISIITPIYQATNSI